METLSPLLLSAPPSKSLSHRTVIGAALAKGTSFVSRVLESDDLERTIDILQSCGAVITRQEPGKYQVTGIGGAPGHFSPLGSADVPHSCFVGESGTTCRLITAILAAGKGTFRIHGAGRMHDRPMGELTKALESLGTCITYEEKELYPPLVLHATGLVMSKHDGWLSVGSDESSQYLSGLLLAAPTTENGLRIILGGSKTVSWPYVALTFQTLETFGVPFKVEALDIGQVCASQGVHPSPQGGDGASSDWVPVYWRSIRQAVPALLRFNILPSGYHAIDTEVEGDYSGASYLLAAGALGSRPVTVQGLCEDSLQGDAAILSILARMGAGVTWGEQGVTISPAPLQGVTVDMGNCPDLVPTVAVLAARASGPTVITNVAHLRLKESDRIAAPVAELARMGCTVVPSDDGLTINPLPAQQAHKGTITFSSHDDHRIAMSVALLELGNDVAVRLDNPGCVAKSYPTFWEDWARIMPQSKAGKK